MLNSWHKLFLLVLFCVSLSLNSFILQAQKIESSPSGAKVYYEGSYLGKTPLKIGDNVFPKPLIYQIRRDKAGDVSKPPYVYVLTLKMPGYEDQTVRIVGEWRFISKYQDQNCTVAPKSWKYSVVMDEIDAPDISEEVPDIHWGIDSDPSGARVFWRVVSRIPNIVKETDFIYLGSTPIDMVKPLNIKGLTSGNSDNVKIVVRIQSKGYKTETRTFSSNLLTDQNEISWFFELTEED